MGKLVVFGGSGGLGSKLVDNLKKDYNVISLSSKDVDVTNFDEVKDFFDNNEIESVLNLSGYNNNMMLHKYQKFDTLETKRQLGVNIEGNLNILANCLPTMRKKKFGRIILISSVLASKPVAGTGVYSGCKAFIDNLVKTCSIENIRHGITCNSIQLGYFDGGMTYDISEKIREDFKNNIPLKRWGKIIELENTIRYLINTEYVTGCSLKINGGIDF
jgi:3-oxoacyl-[acyl-carrier protein] reductase|tara:strand:+ start:48 stop:698 length:651 start_codon:yes stop_codon:yes gene_type:complete